MSQLTTYDIEHILTKFQPKTHKEFGEFGLKLKRLGSGCSREVFELVGYNLAVKIPFVGEEAKRHSLQEYQAYKKVLSTKKYRQLKRYMPEMYCCSKDGIILMKKYKPCKYTKKDKAEIVKVRVLTNYLFPHNDGDADMYGENLGRDAKGRLFILDLGCFYYWEGM